jgi:hypothetical protein
VNIMVQSPWRMSKAIVDMRVCCLSKAMAMA